MFPMVVYPSKWIMCPLSATNTYSELSHLESTLAYYDPNEDIEKVVCRLGDCFTESMLNAKEMAKKKIEKVMREYIDRLQHPEKYSEVKKDLNLTSENGENGENEEEEDEVEKKLMTVDPEKEQYSKITMFFDKRPKCEEKEKKKEEEEEVMKNTENEENDDDEEDWDENMDEENEEDEEDEEDEENDDDKENEEDKKECDVNIDGQDDEKDDDEEEEEEEFDYEAANVYDQMDEMDIENENENENDDDDDDDDDDANLLANQLYGMTKDEVRRNTLRAVQIDNPEGILSFHQSINQSINQSLLINLIHRINVLERLWTWIADPSCSVFSLS